ncbi:alpha/beta-hydrolase [Trametes elegans]|nr:alpha/beta-hydrolase [Trametes elegans]
MHVSQETPFTLSVSEADLVWLHKKLELSRLPDELADAGWEYGVPLAHVRRLLARWKDGFDWRKTEAEINKLPMFTRDIEVEGFGVLNIHYVHQRSEVKNAVPLLFVHGWPGHFLEVRKLLPILTAKSPGHPSFHVVAVSLPGFAFSQGFMKPGVEARQYTELLNKVMLALGYNEYVYQGGDWGHLLGAHIAHHYGHKHVKAWHSNMPCFRAPTLLSHPVLALEPYISAAARERIGRSAKHQASGYGYFLEQATKPQTIGYSLADSPVGLLAWIYEKLVCWTDAYPWTDDEVLEWVSVYWFSRDGPAASVRIYHALTAGSTHDALGGVVRGTIPLGVSYFPKELIQLPKSWSQVLGPVVFESEHDKGGHFAAWEQPEALAGDLRKMYGEGGPAHGVVPGRRGYD